MVENITKSFDDKEYTLGVFLDLSKAFDTIDHSILLAKLNHFGVREVANEWFRSYLNGRLMQTEVNGKISNFKPIEIGVPQGSILGPLLFLIYINDFPKCLTSGKAIMFANDTNLFFNSSSYKALYEVTNTQLKHAEAWLSANKLTLNTDKTLYVAFRTPNSLPPPAALSIQFKNKHLKRVNSCKFLGLTINEHLSWKPHMQWLLQKLRSSYHVINKVKQYLDKSSLLTLYHSLINSYVQYCVISWCHGNASMIQKLQKVSTKAINLINTKQKNSNDFQQHNLLTVQQSKQLEIAKFMHKYFNKSLPLAFSNIFDSNFLSENATLRTRSKSKLYPQYCRIKLTQQTLKFRGPMLWNKLPVALKDIKSLPRFIKCIKEYIINQ